MMSATQQMGVFQQPAGQNFRKPPHHDKTRPPFNTGAGTRCNGSAQRADQGHFKTGRHTGEITMLQYPATIKKTAGSYLVSFVDFDNINTWGKTIEKALANAEEALNGCLESDFERGFSLPEPSEKKGRSVYYIPVRPHIAVALMLRTLRAGRSQREIARRLDISFQVYQRLENPRRSNPTVKTLEKVARVYGKHVALGFM